MIYINSDFYFNLFNNDTSMIFFTYKLSGTYSFLNKNNIKIKGYNFYI